MTNTPRAFKAGASDERAVAMLGIISTVVALQRAQCIWPKLILLNSDVYIVICDHLGCHPLDRLFNVDVHVNLSENAMPFIVVSEGEK